MKDIPCLMCFDERTSTVTLRHRKTQVVLMTIKVEFGGIGTMTRICANGTCDCDNFWIAIKPDDHMVFNGILFDKKKLIIKNIEMTLE